MGFRKKTVFVVGAGASFEVTMPVGDSLADLISDGANLTAQDGRLTGGDPFLLDAVRARYPSHEVNKRMATMREIASGIVMANSIDTYIERHRETEGVTEIGKMLIAYYILRSEEQSLLRVEEGSDGEIDLRALKKTWYHPFARMLMEPVHKGHEEFLGEDITIICFNYDRCIERYLQEAVRQAYHLDQQTASSFTRRIRILRPYGSLGPLPAAPGGHGDKAVGYGEPADPRKIWSLSEQLLTYSEQMHADSQLITEIAAAFSQAQQVIFLGFGYVTQNMRLLSMAAERAGSRNRRVYATGFGISEQEKEDLQGALVMMLSGSWDQVHLELDTTCLGLFGMHGRNFRQPT